MESLIFDTTFLIDFQRERKQGAGAAHAFLEENRDCFARLPVIAYGEFAEGFLSLTDPVFLSVVEAFEILPVTREVADVYSQRARNLRRAGTLIGANDLWIASTALAHGQPLVTRSLREFARIEGIQLKGYGAM